MKFYVSIAVEFEADGWEAANEQAQEYAEEIEAFPGVVGATPYGVEDEAGDDDE